MKKILIAEDDPFVLDMIQAKFSEGGFDVTTAVDGEDALNKAKDHSYDLLLLDVMMPKMNGFEVLREVRKDSDSKKAETPAIMFTNLDQQNDKDLGLELGASDYINKDNFTPSEVLDRVNTFFNKQK